MTAHSSISSSDTQQVQSATQTAQPAPEAKRGGNARGWPVAPAIAIVLVLLVHGFATLRQPHPVARPQLRQKALNLTEKTHPAVVLAGDSRARCSLIPSVFQRQLGLPARLVVNIGHTTCDAASALTAFSEIAPRCQRRPLLLLSVSVFSVNDGAKAYIGDEVLWTVPLTKRCQLVGPGRALSSVFLPEKALWQRLWPVLDDVTSEAGFQAQSAGENVLGWDEPKRKQVADVVLRDWHAEPRVDGVLWEHFRRGVESASREAQVVLIDPPYHPFLARYLAERPEGMFDARFHDELRQLAGELRIPLLQYNSGVAGDKGDALFADLLHFNCAGAQVFSDRVAQDVRRFIQDGRLTLYPASGEDGKLVASVRERPGD